jgi:hypothetical protein
MQSEPQKTLWEEARDRYKKTLKPAQQKKFEEAFTNATTYADVITVAEAAGQRVTHKLSKRVRSVLQPLQELAPALDVVSNINSAVGCSIWGPLKLIIQVS